jgi:hypothetical protein
VRIDSPCPTHSTTEWAPRPLVSSRTRSIAASPRSLTTSVELASEGNAIGVAAEQDDLLGTETTGGNDAAETHRAIANDGGNLAGRTSARNAA